MHGLMHMSSIIWRSSSLTAYMTGKAPRLSIDHASQASSLQTHLHMPVVSQVRCGDRHHA